MSKNNPKYRPLRHAACAALTTLLLGSVFVQPALAQFGGPPSGRPPFGGRGMGMRGPRPMSAADVPLSALAMSLNLTAAQKSQISGIQQQFRQQRTGLMPRFGGPGGGPPDFGAMRAALDKMRGLDQSASARIQGILTGPQRQALPGLLKMMDDLRAAGIPAETYADLRLTTAQKTQITSLARTAQAGMRPPVPGGGPPDWQAMRAARAQTTQKAMALLTPSQQALVSKYKAAHPRPGRGFGPPPGGFGPPPSSV